MPGSKPGWLEKFGRETEKAIKHVEFRSVLYKYQLQQGRRFRHEHPWTARSWKLKCVDELLKHPTVNIVQGHMCQFRMMSHVDRPGGEMGLVKKPIGFMTSSRCVAKELDKRCDGGRSHVPLKAGRAAAAQAYPDMLCEAICRGVVKQKKFDNSNIVTTGKLSYMGLKRLVRHICDLQGSGVNMIEQVLSTSLSEGARRPTGDYPQNWVDDWHEEDGGDDHRGV